MTIINIADYRDNQREREASAEIITLSLIEYTDQTARALIGAERVFADDEALAATIVQGWIAANGMRARDPARSARERAVAEFVAGARKGDPIELLARKQVGDHLRLMREIYEELARAEPLAPPN